jgi:hypothetical protein
MATHTLPVQVSDDAEAYVESLGLRPEFEAMLEHAKQAIPGVRSILVRVDDSFETGEPIILILADLSQPGTSGPGGSGESAELAWDRWAVETFPPDVNRHFCMMAIHGTGDDAR